MPNFCSEFLRSQDSLSLGIKLNYKKKPQFGTICGGCCSFLLNLFTITFIFAQLYSLCFQPNYDQTAAVTYLSNSDSEAHTISTEVFMPQFAVVA